MTNTMERIFEPPETKAAKRHRIRTRIALGTVGVVLAASVVMGSYTWFHICGSLGSGVWQVEGECVGVTDGSYLFDPEFETIQKKIVEENARVRAQADSYITVALLDLLTPTVISAKSAENVRHGLEGAYTAQRRLNETVIPGASRPQIQLVLANKGNTDEQWRRVTAQLVAMKSIEGDGALVAVIGLGVSTTQTQHNAEALANDDIPMVGTLLTANELDYNHITGLIRVSPTTLDYAKALRSHVDTRTDLTDPTDPSSAVVVYDMNSDTADLFTKSLKNDLEQEMQNLIKGRPPLPFFGASIPSEVGAGRFDLLTPNICAPPADVVLYAGRRVDLGGLLDWLARRGCVSTPLTVITAADIGELLSTREQQLTDANLTVVSAGTNDAEGWGRGAEKAPEHYDDFLMAFRELGFDPENNAKDLVDGQAIQMHDALLTVEQAVRLAAPENSSPTAGQVRGVLLTLSGENKVQGAGGTLSFISRATGAGNPVGKWVPVLKFPSPSADPFGRQVVTPSYVTE
ncbi:MAG: hypothetical protein ACRDTC_25160 [Pseudonocardiaceae bacterium]